MSNTPIERCPELKPLSMLSTCDIDSLRREKIRSRAKRQLLAQYQPQFQWLSAVNPMITRYFEPAFVSALSIIILIWTIERTLFLLTP